jgi:translation initiation factor IF-2
MIIAGSCYGRIRAMFDENNNEVKVAKPSQPVKVTGLNVVPLAGDHFAISNNERDIKDIAEKIRLYQIQQQNAEHEILSKDEKTNNKKLIVILKTDVHGSLEAIKNVLNKTNVHGVSLVVLRAATGGITKSDIELAKASGGIIIGFNVKPIKTIKDFAQNQQVQIYFFDVIYHLAEEIENIMKGKLDPVFVEEETGEAEVKEL